MRVDLSEGFDHPKFRNKSTWQPKGPHALEAFAFCNDCHLLRKTDYRRPRDNLSPAERTALKQLQNLENVIIKPADKGSAVVLQNTSDYIIEGFRQLNDTKFYQEQITDLSDTHMESIRAVCSGMLRNGEISEKCFKYLTQFTMRTSRFYMLPKIHKGTFPPLGRPIISRNGCPSERISSFVDIFLKEISPKGKSYLKDTTHFIQTLEELGKFQKEPSWQLWAFLAFTPIFLMVKGLDPWTRSWKPLGRMALNLPTPRSYTFSPWSSGPITSTFVGHISYRWEAQP